MKNKYFKKLIISAFAAALFCGNVLSIGVNAEHWWTDFLKSSETVSNAFNRDFLKLWDEYAECCGWNEERFRQWTYESTAVEDGYSSDDSPLTEHYDIEELDDGTRTAVRDEGKVDRLAAYQYQLLQDNYKTTGQILWQTSLTSAFSFLGNGSSQGNMLAEFAISQIGTEANADKSCIYNSYQPVDWCCFFVTWCAREMGLCDDGIFSYEGACMNLDRFFKEQNCQEVMTADVLQGLETDVQPGDIIFFIDESRTSGDYLRWSHVGIVVEYGEDENGPYLVTVEGNTSGANKYTGSNTDYMADFNPTNSAVCSHEYRLRNSAYSAMYAGWITRPNYAVSSASTED